MRLKVLLPTEVLVDEEVVKVIAEAENGAFCLLPRHIDFAAALAPSVLSFRTAEGEERFAAVDGGILVKHGRDVSVSTPDGVRDLDLERLKELIQARYVELDAHERHARKVLARLEAGALRRFKELEERFHG